jgi:hypothetical protein
MYSLLLAEMRGCRRTACNIACDLRLCSVRGGALSCCVLANRAEDAVPDRCMSARTLSAITLSTSGWWFGNCLLNSRRIVSNSTSSFADSSSASEVGLQSYRLLWFVGAFSPYVAGTGEEDAVAVAPCNLFNLDKTLCNLSRLATSSAPPFPFPLALLVIVL